MLSSLEVGYSRQRTRTERGVPHHLIKGRGHTDNLEFLTRDLSLLPGLFTYSVIFLHQYGLIYFIFEVISQYYATYFITVAVA